jgi:nucleoid-associated protein YgaU
MKKLREGLMVLLVGVVLTVVSACATTEKKEEAPAPAEPQAAPEPAPAPKAEPAPAPAPAPEMKKEEMKAEVVMEEGLTRYTVVAGDNLWAISSFRVIYGNPYMWPLIYKANVDQIKDADLIHPGQVLRIERDSSASSIEAAIQHARTRGAWSIGVVEQTDVDYLRSQGITR